MSSQPMAEPAIALDDIGQLDEVQQFGYTQKLKRTVTAYESFALAFAVVSITTGIFTTYGFALTTSGPRGIWMWLVAGAGQLLVALVFAQLSTHIPLSGSSYQWASRLANPKIGWGFGWLAFSFFAVGMVSVGYSFTTQALTPLFNLHLSTTGTTEVTIVVFAFWAIICICSTKVMAGLSLAAVIAEIIAVAGISIALLAGVALFGDHGSVSNLVAKGAIPSAGYYAYNGPFMLAVLLGAFTLTGFEAAINVSEETATPEDHVPRALVRAVALSVALGMVFLIALTVAIPNLSGITSSSAPVAQILHDQFGNVVEKMFLVVVCIAILAAGMVCMISSARIIYSMSRDRRFPGHRLFSMVPAGVKTPVPATVAVFVVGALLMVFVGSDPATLSNLFTASAILPALIYLATMVLFLAKRHRLPTRSRHFDLGKWAVPTAVTAIIWLTFELTVLLLPSIFWTAVKICAIFLGSGAVVFVGIWLFDRRALEHEPGAISLESATPADEA